MNGAKRAELLKSALRKERLLDAAPGSEPELSLVAEKIELAKFRAPLDEEASALQAELQILQQLKSAARPTRAREHAPKVAGLAESRGLLRWRYPAAYRALDDDKREVLFMNGGIALEDGASGDSARWVPIVRFEHMRLPRELLEHLRIRRQISAPTPVQQIALPVIFSGRDVLGVAGTGSGKTLCYLLPLALLCLHFETALSFERDEGPCALVMVPSRELASQVSEIGQDLLTLLARRRRLAPMNFPAVIGGLPLREQRRLLGSRACHALCATPGRLKDLLEQKVVDLSQTRLLVLDEADRLLDDSFSQPVRAICMSLHKSVQTVLFSATMPRRVKHFAHSALKTPVTIYVGRAGSACPQVRQKLDIVAPAARLKFLLMAIQETPPPVVVFCGNKAEVDDVLERLILAGVEATAIHGCLDQRDRIRALAQFTRGERDVLVGTDVASKGLDLADVQHVINYTMPVDIEDYIHRIGRTGRRGQFGLATTLVTSVANETFLLDLRGVLLEARQKVPRFLNQLAAARGLPEEHIECAFCGGPGHRVMTCAKLQAFRLKAVD